MNRIYPSHESRVTSHELVTSGCEAAIVTRDSYLVTRLSKGEFDG